MTREFLNPPTLCPTHGWTHVVATAGVQTIHISGQTAVNAAGEVVGKGDYDRPTAEVLDTVLQAGRRRFARIVAKP